MSAATANESPGSYVGWCFALPVNGQTYNISDWREIGQ
jgi:hypothetical protein